MVSDWSDAPLRLRDAGARSAECPGDVGRRPARCVVGSEGGGRMAEASEAIWTIKGCLDWTVGYLERKGDEHPRVSAEWLLSSALGVNRINLYMSFDRPLSMEERSTIREAVKRRGRGEPLQYVTGETSFRGHEIWCEPGVLIPRPETELLTDLVLRYLDKYVLGKWNPERKRIELPWNDTVEAARQAEAEARRAQAEADDGTSADGALSHDAVDEAGSTASEYVTEDDGALAAAWGAAPDVMASLDASESLDDDAANTAANEPLPTARVLEVGCGTGCISLSLALERAGRVTCVATDIDEAPIRLAQRNRARYQMDERTIDIRQGDLVAPVRHDEYGSFDVLVSNPPYIPSDVVDGLGHEVKDFEPRLALDGGKDGLDVFRRLAQTAPYMLKPGGLFACELYETTLQDAAAYCSDQGFAEVHVVADLTHRPRFVFAIMPREAAGGVQG